MFDYINRFLNPDIDPSQTRYFDEFFEDDGAWRTIIPNASDRQEAILSHYKHCLKSSGSYKHVVNTRILKPTREQTFFHLIYATRSPTGLEEFKKVDCKMQEKQIDVRKEAIYQEHVGRTGQLSLWGKESVDTESTFSKRRETELEQLEGLLKKMLQDHESFTFKELLLRALEIEMICDKDVGDIVVKAKKDGLIQIQNWDKRQRRPKDHNIISVVR
jgi:hypothetical protein